MIFFFALWIANLAAADESCLRFDLGGQTADPRWSEFVVSVTKSFGKNGAAEVEAFSRRADGESFGGSFTCSRMNDGSYGCYAEGDSGFFRLAKDKNGTKLVVPRFVNLGDEEKPARIEPKGEEIAVKAGAGVCQAPGPKKSH